MKADKNIISKLFLPIRRRRWMSRAEKFLAADRFAEAALWCEMTLEADRNFGRAKNLKKIIKERAVAWAARAALEDAELPEEREMDAILWLIESERPKEAGALVRRAIRRHYRSSPDSPPPEWLRSARAETDFLAGDIKAAADQLEELRSSGQFSAEATYYSALCEIARGDRPKALSLLRGFIAKYPWFTEARFEDILEEAP